MAGLRHDFKNWMPFLLVSFIYIFLSLYISYYRFLNIDYFINIPYGITDYAIHTILAGVVAAGNNPYSNFLCYYGTYVIFPRMWSQYIGNTIFNAFLVVLTSQTAAFVVCSLSPAIINITMVLCIYISCRIMKFSPTKSFFFFIFFCFLNEQMLYRTTYGSGELLGTAIGLVGFSYFVIKKYYKSVIFIAISMVIHPVGLSSYAILFILFGLYSIHSLIKNRSQLYNMFSKINLKNIHNSDTAKFYSLVILTIVLAGFLTPVIMPQKYYWNVPSNVTSTSKISEIITTVGTTSKTETEYVNITKSTTTVSVLSTVIQSTKVTTAISTKTSTTSMVSQSSYLANFQDTILNRINWGSHAENLTNWLNPHNFVEVLYTFSYPITYMYESFMPRVALNSTLSLFGYTLTKEDVSNLQHFNLQTPIYIILVPLIFAFGFPLIFIFTIWVNIKTRNMDTILLSLSAYLLIISFSLVHLFFGFSLFPERFIRSVGGIFILCIFTAGYTKQTKMIEKICLYGFSIFLVMRFIIFILGVIVVGGL